MSVMKRHIGRITNTDRKIVVVYMQIPGREDHALVVDTDSLPDKYHDDLMQVVEGEGQKEPVLANILTRRMMTYTGVDMLTSLHHANQLQPVPVSNIVMLPEPRRPIPLSKIIEYMSNEPTKVAPEVPEVRENRILENQQIDKMDGVYNIAKNLLIEADMLADEAQRKRNQAYEMYPDLKPKPSIKLDVTADLTDELAMEAIQTVRKDIQDDVRDETPVKKPRRTKKSEA